MDKKNNQWRRAAVIISGIVIVVAAVIIIDVRYLRTPEPTAETPTLISGTQPSDNQASKQKTPPEKKQAKNITLIDQDNREVELREYINDKPIVLHFWVTWCHFCQEEFPEMLPIYDSYKEDVTFLMVSIAEERRDIEQFMTENGYTFTYFIDSEGEGARTYGVTGTPTTFFISSTGIIENMKTGMVDWQNPQSEQMRVLDAMLAENS